MKKILLLLLIVVTIFTVPVFAEDTNMVVTIPVESNTEGSVISISGERNLPDITEISSSGEFILDFTDSSLGDIYEYEITQIKVDDNYYIDTTKYDVRVYILIENGNKTPIVTINKQGETEKDISCEFKNKEKPHLFIDIPITKIVKATDKKDNFTFILKSTDMPMPEDSVNGEKKITRAGAGEYSFGEIELKTSGIYEYTIQEEIGSLNYDYDTTIYTVKCIVDEVNGKLSKTIEITNDKGEKVEEITFTNTLKTPEEPVEPEKPETPPKPPVKTENPPRTGDNNNIILYAGILGGAILCTIIVLLMKRKK